MLSILFNCVGFDQSRETFLVLVGVTEEASLALGGVMEVTLTACDRLYGRLRGCFWLLQKLVHTIVLGFSSFLFFC